MNEAMGRSIAAICPLAGSVLIYTFALMLPGREHCDPENDALVQRLYWTGHLLAVGGLIMARAVLE